MSKAARSAKPARTLQAFYASVRGTTDWEPAPMPVEATRQVRL